MADPVPELRLPRLPQIEPEWFNMQAWWQRVVEQLEATVRAINASIQDVASALAAAVAAQQSADAAQDAAIAAAADAAAAQSVAGDASTDAAAALAGLATKLSFNGVETATNKTLTTPVINGGRLSIRTATVTGSVLVGDDTILGNATGGAIVMTLPPAASSPGQRVTLKKIDASANTVTLDGNGAETIDGAANVVITAQWDAYTIQSNGTAWFVI